VRVFFYTKFMKIMERERSFRFFSSTSQ